MTGSAIAHVKTPRGPTRAASQPEGRPTAIPPVSVAIRPSVWIWPISSSFRAISTLSASATTSWTM